MERYGEADALAICKVLYEKKAIDILALHIGDKTIIADWFVVASGTSVTHVRALCDELEEKAAELGLPIRRKEGYEEARWIVLRIFFSNASASRLVFAASHRPVYIFPSLVNW